MGLVQAVVGAVGGTLADQWKDFYTVPAGLPSTAALFAAVPQGTNAGRGSNTHGSSNIITNGSKIIVPEGYGLLLFQDGKITALAACSLPGFLYNWYRPDGRLSPDELATELTELATRVIGLRPKTRRGAS